MARTFNGFSETEIKEARHYVDGGYKNLRGDDFVAGVDAYKEYMVRESQKATEERTEILPNVIYEVQVANQIYKFGHNMALQITEIDQVKEILPELDRVDPRETQK